MINANVVATPTETSHRIAWLDIGRGASILLVIFFHASMLVQETGRLHPAHWIINDFFQPIRMPLFFAISGLLGAKAMAADWPHLLKKRVLLLWYVYAVWVVCTLIIDFVTGNKVSVLDAIALAIWPSSTLWYLWVLGFYFIIARVFAGRMQLRVLIIASIASLLLEGKFFEIAPLEHFKAIVYAPFFLGGVWYGGSLLRLLARPWKTFVMSAACFAFLFFALRWNYAPSGVGIVASVFGLVAGMSGSIILGRITYVGSALAYFGRNTLPVYVSHFLFLKLCVFIGISIGMVALPGFGVWGALFMSSAALGLSLSLSRIINDYNAKWLLALPKMPATRVPTVNIATSVVSAPHG